MIGILLLIKESLKDNESFKPTTVPAKFENEALKTFSFLDYVTAVKTPRTCVDMPFEMRFDRRDFWTQRFSISGINPGNWPVPFLKCDFRQCEEAGQDATDFCTVHVLAVAPSTEGELDRALAFQDYILETYPQIPVDMVKQFSSTQEIDEYVTDKMYGVKDESRPKIAVAVVIGGSGKDYEYTIRANSTNFNSPELAGRPVMATHPDTKTKFDLLARQAKNVCDLEGGTSDIGKSENQCTNQYMYNGALTIQRLVDDFIIHDTGARVAGSYVAEGGVSFVNFPSREFVKDGFYATVSPYVPLLLVLGLLYPVASIIRSTVTEKELRQKELMKMMSISESAIELSWFISSYSFFFISGILSTITSALLYPNASPVTLLIFWELAFLAIVLFALAVSAVFSKSTRATLVGILVFFAGYFLTLSAEYETGSRAIIALVSLHPVAALTYGIQIIGSLEDAGVGLNGGTLTFGDNPSGYNFASTMGNLFFDVFYWGFLMWYWNRVIAGDYGQALPWNFPFTSSYWCGGREDDEELVEWEQNSKYENVPIESVGPTFKEQEREGMGVHIRGLSKQFGDKTAVDGLDLSMYTGQVFALLGHNGAGKLKRFRLSSHFRYFV